MHIMRLNLFSESYVFFINDFLEEFKTKLLKFLEIREKYLELSKLKMVYSLPKQIFVNIYKMVRHK